MLLDSNILIACLAGDPGVKSFVLASQERCVPLFISVVSLAELTSFTSLTEADIARIQTFADEFYLLPVDRGIAEIGGQFRKVHGLSLPDALIAATASIKNLPLITRDKKLLRLKEITARSL